MLLLLLEVGGCIAFAPLAAVRRRVVPVRLKNQQQPGQLQLLSWKTRRRRTAGRYDGESATTTRALGLLLPRETLATAVDVMTSTMLTVPRPQDMVSTETAGAATTAEVIVATGLDPSTTVFIFLVGLVPFAVATVEFWRRIKFGQAFGTGSDSVVFTDTVVSIGEEDAPLSSRGTRVLGPGALIAAIVLFAVAAFVIGLAIVSVVTSDIPTSL
jgi:hypothetical protein